MGLISSALLFRWRLCLLPFFCGLPSQAQGLPVAAPQTVGMNAGEAQPDRRSGRADIKDKKLPGAVVLVGHKGKIVFRKAYGNRSLVPTVEPMTVDTIFDLASLTKVVATTTSIMILVEQGKLRLRTRSANSSPTSTTSRQNASRSSSFSRTPPATLPISTSKKNGPAATECSPLSKKKSCEHRRGRSLFIRILSLSLLGRLFSELKETRTLAFAYSRKNVFDRWMTNSGFSLKFGWSASAKNSRFVTRNCQMIHCQHLGKVKEPIAPTENIKGQNSYLGSTFEGDGNLVIKFFGVRSTIRPHFVWAALPATPDFSRRPTIFRVSARCF